MELGNEFILEPNEHFNNLLVNTTYSDIQLPTNVYNKGTALLLLFCYSYDSKAAAEMRKTRAKRQLATLGAREEKQDGIPDL